MKNSPRHYAKIAELAGKVIDLGQTSQINSSRTVVRMDRGSTAAGIRISNQLASVSAPSMGISANK